MTNTSNTRSRLHLGEERSKISQIAWGQHAYRTVDGSKYTKGREETNLYILAGNTQWI